MNNIQSLGRGTHRAQISEEVALLTWCFRENGFWEYKLGQIVSTGNSSLFLGDEALPFKALLCLLVFQFTSYVPLTETKWGHLGKENCGLQDPKVSNAKPSIKEQLEGENQDLSNQHSHRRGSIESVSSSRTLYVRGHGG